MGSAPPARRLICLALLGAALAATGCAHGPVTTADDSAARIDTGAPLNARPETFRLAGVRVTLEKVVALPGDELGLRFSFGSSSPDCCSLFPRAALDETTGNPHPTDVVIPVSNIGADGILQMHMWRRDTGQKPAFQVDLAGLGVPTT